MKGKDFINEKNLMWIVIIITALGLATKIALDNYRKVHKPAICYIDASQIIDDLAISYSLNVNKPFSSMDINAKEKADMLMNKLKSVLSNPKRFGCRAIFLRGAILSGGKDITAEVLQDVRASQTSP